MTARPATLVAVVVLAFLLGWGAGVLARRLRLIEARVWLLEQIELTRKPVERWGL